MGGDGSALDFREARVAVDPESAEVLAFAAGSNPDNAELIGPLLQGVLIHDRAGHEVCVTEDKRLHVVDSSGLPHLFPVDAAGANTYTLLGIVPKAATRLLFSVATKDAILSFDGATDHLILNATKGQLLIDGLDLPKGTEVYGKNQAAGQNYANLYVAVW